VRQDEGVALVVHLEEIKPGAAARKHMVARSMTTSPAHRPGFIACAITWCFAVFLRPSIFSIPILGG
jgi:hypothetical protein